MGRPLLRATPKTPTQLKLHSLSVSFRGVSFTKTDCVVLLTATTMGPLSPFRFSGGRIHLPFRNADALHNEDCQSGFVVA